MHEFSWFVTLTYDNEHLPIGGNLVPRDLQLFIKRLRKAVYPEKIRYYGVGEYGDVSKRPHYHVLLYGLRDVSAIRDAWKCGMIHVGTVTPQSVSYCVSYMLKGMTKKTDLRLVGLYPEFARMSNGGRAKTGGIGAGACEGILDVVASKSGVEYVIRTGDVPYRVRAEGKMWPLGRYLLNRLRTGYGMDDACRARVVAAHAVELQAELSVPGSRDLREQKRLQASRRAKALFQISRSKKGIGL